MVKKILVDTNIIIEYSRGNGEFLLNLINLSEQNKLDLYINSIIATEFFCGTDLNNKKFYQQAFMFFDNFFTCIDIGFQEALFAGELKRKNVIPLLTDALIASTCIVNNFELATDDSKHFSNIPDLKLYKFESLKND